MLSVNPGDNHKPVCCSLKSLSDRLVRLHPTANLSDRLPYYKKGTDKVGQVKLFQGRLIKPFYPV